MAEGKSQASTGLYSVRAVKRIKKDSPNLIHVETRFSTIEFLFIHFSPSLRLEWHRTIRSKRNVSFLNKIQYRQNVKKSTSAKREMHWTCCTSIRIARTTDVKSMYIFSDSPFIFAEIVRNPLENSALRIVTWYIYYSNRSSCNSVEMQRGNIATWQIVRYPSKAQRLKAALSLLSSLFLICS